MNRKATVIVLSTAIAAMAFAGVALSLDRAKAPGGPTPEQAAEVLRKAPGTKEKTRASPRVDGERWGLRSFANTRGDVCFSHDVPGELVGTGCMPVAKLFRRGPLLAYRGARQRSASYRKLEWDNQWVYGIAHPDIKTLTLVNMNCSTLRLSLDEDGVFHHVVGREQITKGALPYKLHARAATGELLAVRHFAASLPWNARSAGLPRPRARRACS